VSLYGQVSEDSARPRAFLWLNQLVVAEWSGVVEIAGELGGSVALSRGFIAEVTSRRAPGVGALLIGSGRVDEVAWYEFERGDDVLTKPPAGLARLEWDAAVHESSVDALRELLSMTISEADLGHAVAEDGLRTAGKAFRFPDLLVEVVRRQNVLMQVSGVLTPDSTVARSHLINGHAAQVSAHQWQLLKAVGSDSTVRELAWATGRSVFATTVVAYQLVTLGLLSTDAQSAASAGEHPSRLSFLAAGG
jgi:hypothetical protein